VCILLLFFDSAISFAQKSIPSNQPSSESNIQSWLRSQDPQQIAWGAHYTLATKDQALVPDLLALAYSWQSLPQPSRDEQVVHGLTSDQLDRRDAMAAVLDALIQLHVAVPVETLRNLAADFPNPVAVLMSSLPLKETTALSFDFYRSDELHNYSLRYVSAALLAQDPPPGFAADLFSGVHIRANIFVIAPGAAGYGTGRGGHDCGISVPASSQQEWPNFGVYGFSKEKIPGSFPIVSGADPIYATRSENTHYLGETCAFMISLGPEERRRLLTQMLSVSTESIGWKTEILENIEYKSAQQFASDLQSVITAQQEKYRVTAAALVSKGLMTSAEEEESMPFLDLHINDMRGTGSSPIAALSPLPTHVTWSDNPWR
jgi:hypothetical protein